MFFSINKKKKSKKKISLEEVYSIFGKKLKKEVDIPNTTIYGPSSESIYEEHEGLCKKLIRPQKLKERPSLGQYSLYEPFSKPLSPSQSVNHN